jgi:hypothetical protein
MKQVHEFNADAVFTNGARLAWKIQASTTAQAHARAWEILARLLEDGTAEAVLGTDAQVVELAVMLQQRPQHRVAA